MDNLELFELACKIVIIIIKFEPFEVCHPGAHPLNLLHELRACATSVNAPVALGYQKAKAKKSSSVLIMHTHVHIRSVGD